MQQVTDMASEFLIAQICGKPLYLSYGLHISER
jgi:hypothetical protein